MRPARGHSNFDQNDFNGSTNYNDIGVKVCDNSGSASGGFDNDGYGTGNFGSGDGNNGGRNQKYCGSTRMIARAPRRRNTRPAIAPSSGDNGGTGPTTIAAVMAAAMVMARTVAAWHIDGDNGCGGSTNDGGCGSGGSGTCSETQLGASGVADTVTVTGTSAGATVTTSDTAEIIVLSSQNNVSVNGTTPTGSLMTSCSTSKARRTLEFNAYNPEQHSLQTNEAVSIGKASTGSNSNAMAFIVIGNNANPERVGRADLL